MFNGTIYITYDINLCLSNLGNCKSIIVADNTDVYNIPDKIGGSLLLPPYEALAAMIDENDEKFRYEYLRYLSTDPMVIKFIDIILQALISGTNMLLFIEPEGPNYTMVLKEYFLESFGIVLGDQNVPFQYNQAFFPIVISRLYMNDAIPKEYFLKLFPENIQFDNFVLQKLIYEYGLVFNYIEAESYLKKISKVLKNNGEIKGVIRRL